MPIPPTPKTVTRRAEGSASKRPSSANSAGWPEVTNYMLPVAFQLALNGYGISLDTWNKLSPEDQKKLEAGFDGLIEDIWDYSKTLFDDAVRCNVGEDPCETVKKYSLKEVPITDEDRKIIQNAVKDISFPTWAAVCDKTNPKCSSSWKETVGKQIGF